MERDQASRAWAKNDCGVRLNQLLNERIYDSYLIQWKGFVGRAL